MDAAPQHPFQGRPLKREVMRWTGAGSCIAALHVGIALAIVYWPQPKLAAAELPAAVMIELSPMPTAPDTPPEDVAVGPEVDQSDAADESTDRPVKESAPERPTEAPEEEVVEKTESDIDTPKLEEKPDAEVVLPTKSAAATEPEKPKDEHPPTKEEKKKEQKPEKPSKKSTASVSAKPKPVPAAKAAVNAAAASGVASSMSQATWRGMVQAHLNRHKRSLGGAGTSTIAFTIDRSGRVLSARLVRSSGSAALDSEAVAIARRASPVPAPPPDGGKSSFLLQVPVRFSR